MLGLLTTQVTPPERWYERLPWRRPRKVEIIASALPRYLNAAVDWPLNLSDTARRERVRRACAELMRRGVANVVMPPEYVWPEDAVPALNVCVPVPLYRRLAWRVATREAHQKGFVPSKLTVALLARHPSSLLTEAVRALKHEAATIAIWAGRDTEAFCYGLRKYEGMSLLAQENPTANIYILLEPPAVTLAVPDTALTLDFSGISADVRGGVTADALELSPPSAWDSCWPWRCDTQAMLLGLYADGQLSLSDIRIGGLLRQGVPVRW